MQKRESDAAELKRELGELRLTKVSYWRPRNLPIGIVQGFTLFFNEFLKHLLNIVFPTVKSHD